jgi:flagellar motor switch/type III secretory pathway protein FliN
MARRVAAYPWHALERLDRASLRALNRIRQSFELPPLGALAHAIGELALAEARLVVRRSGRGARRPRGLLLPFDVAAGERARVTLGLEPPVASRLLAPLLGRSVGVDRLDATDDPALLGALAAVAVETLRRAGGPSGLFPAADDAVRFAPQFAAVFEVELSLDGRGYAIDVLVELDALPEPEASPRLAALGPLPIELVVVVALSRVTIGELASLEPGAAWMPGGGWWIDAGGSGRGALASPLAESGVAVDLAQDGRIVLRGDRVELPVESEASNQRMTDDTTTTERPLEQTALDAPLIVRVELGAVTLSAKEWAALRPGDVIETGRRVGEPVVLRVSGREIARGELVDIEGELGVRIRELVGEESA